MRTMAVQRARWIGVATAALSLTLGASIAVGAQPPADTIASAMEVAGTTIQSAEFLASPPRGETASVWSQTGVGFPREGAEYAVLSTGYTGNVFGPATSNLSSDLDGPSFRGNTDRDVTVLRINFLVPSGRNCLSLDMRMLSEEFPEFPGKLYNDGFVAELDYSDWTTVASRVIAPHNFAFRAETVETSGQPLNIRTVGSTSASAANAGSTRFDGATPLLRATTPVSPGSHSLYLSLFDQGDGIYDTAMFLDRLRAYATSKTACPLGAFPLVRPVVKIQTPLLRTNGMRVFRANISSESAISRIVVSVDGRAVYARNRIPLDERDINVLAPIKSSTLSRGRHTIRYLAQNRAGEVVASETIAVG